MMSESFSLQASLTFGRNLRDTKIAFASEWVRMLVTSASVESGRMGMATRPNAAAEKNATPQLGWFCERIATPEPAPMP